MINVLAFSLNPFQENTYLLWNEKLNAIIIDPGCYFTAEEETLQNFIKEKNLRPVQLINTHCHIDHIFGNKWAAKTFHLELFLHPNEKPVLEFGAASGSIWGLNLDPYNGPLHFLEDGDRINLDDDKLKVILAPGHSPGSVCLYCEAQKFLIGGDVLFYESIGRTDLPGGNHEQLLQSIHEQLFKLPDETIVYPGHGPETTIGHEKKFNPFLHGSI
jgi:hydroxyacylglutathione hydrolase